MYKVFIFCLSVKCVLSANILYVSPIPSPSHHIWNRALALGLVNKGHSVTLIGPDKDKVHPKNYSHIYMEGIYEELDDSFDINEMGTYSPAQMMLEFESWSLFSCEKALKTQGLQKLLGYPADSFDLIIFDVTTGSCFYPLIQKFNYPPSIAVTAFLLPTYVAHNFGNHLYPSYIPWYGLQYTSEMSFVERVWNFIFTYADVVRRKISLYQKEHSMAKEIFGENIPSMEELERHISLVLANTDPILDFPQPVPPNIIPVGGLHTRKSKDLPQDILTVLDNAKHGIIVFSLGSNLRSDKLNKQTQNALLEAFSKIQETVIWKFESDIENLPKNVIVRKWLPQNDILGHPNVKLFIGHGGALSTQEALYHGVPMICVPFIVDQHINTRIIVNKNLGIHLDFKKITAGYVLQLLREVLDNPKYTENMKKISNIFRDRLETPLERGVFWVEYVLRHGGAQFLTTPARDFSYFKACSLDVIAFLFAIATVIVIIVCKMFALIMKACSSKKKIKVN
ncbi:UDP-glucuronosyltransferase 2B31-like Protein [Tribolium castaneum]|uniref:UDP-glucuronosyltransferase n=1 Tax=Tribolium castaneum TaxID=7070 RepID=D6WT25_TRICA|nr:PREDICTED: UDP-glucuronosyltransferase 2B17 [Tribolium castaneum]EFA05873.2 UDP-glucuronosyltransferase 2B31-like Protein [Tribolium castaneum]|eukprot:XP_008196343.1 PREDICTED: UDP-glucuronosyltransferase 2B17 [Tribolium castaneum]